MENLMDIYESIDNPIDDLENLKRIIRIYSESKESGSNFYTEMLRENSMSKENQGFDRPDDEEILEIWRFNTWKSNIVNMTHEKYEEIYGDKKGYYSREFMLLRDYLKRIDDVKNSDDENKIKNEMEREAELKSAFDKYNYEIFQGGWEYISCAELLETKPIQVKHRLYLNIDGIAKYRLIGDIINKIIVEDGNPVHLKYNSADRDDTIVMWMDDENLPKTIEALRSIREKSEDYYKGKIYEPPILTGVIDGWIGYGSEPAKDKDGNSRSFNSVRKQILNESIENATLSWLKQNQDREIEFEGIKLKFSEYLALKCTYKFVKKTERWLSEPDIIEDVQNNSNKVFSTIRPRIGDALQIFDKENLSKLDDKKLKELNLVGINFNQRENMNITLLAAKDIFCSTASAVFKIDENFAEMVRREIKQLSKKYGIDENNFCFDTDRVQEMQEYDERNKANSNDLEMRNDTQIVNEENNRSSAEANTQSNDDNKIKEEQEIEEILKKVLNLTPENRRKAFQVLEDLENEQSKAERR